MQLWIRLKEQNQKFGCTEKCRLWKYCNENYNRQIKRSCNVNRRNIDEGYLELANIRRKTNERKTHREKESGHQMIYQNKLSVHGCESPGIGKFWRDYHKKLALKIKRISRVYRLLPDILDLLLLRLVKIRRSIIPVIWCGDQNQNSTDGSVQ